VQGFLGSRTSFAVLGVPITVGEYAATHEEVQRVTLDNGGSGFNFAEGVAQTLSSTV